MTKKGNGFWTTARKFDIYAPDVSLTFKGSTRFRTVTGAILTALSMLIVGVYTLDYLQKVFQKEIDSVSTQKIHRSVNN